ncbi:hypothetical protein [Alkalicoccus daliensis]|uniref:Uncharacterized protein n=1 Tax=Alkalicoccus daliensis TaxID=745820 RepID=A0A1H0AYF7_9BACI|nr:hypothetical protein [Alkalicoccus daliensis]SDN38455.1 hypothetical protein SAMN04488053_101674 [Alkalicoccus daliensis]
MVGMYISFTVIGLLQALTIFLIWKSKSKMPVKQAENPVEETVGETEWLKEVIRTLEFQCLRIRNAVDKQTDKIHYTEMKLAPKHYLGGDERLLNALSEEQKALVEEFYRLYQTYLQQHWFTKKGTLKTVFSGNDSLPDSDAAQLKYASKELVEKMDAWFIAWRKYL